MNEMFKKPKVIFMLALGLALVVFLFQNTQVVSIRFLFWKLSMSRIILIPILIMIGFIAGFIVGKRFNGS